MDPATLAIVGSIASAGVGALGAIRSASAAAAQANYQAQVAANNQKIAEQNANTAIQAGEAKATAQSLKNRSIQGGIIAGEAGAGLDVNSGSPIDLRDSAARIGQLDVETTRYNAQQQAYGFRTQGMGYTAQAGLEQAAAANAPTAGLLSATGTLLGGAGSVADKWLRYQSDFGNS